MKKQILCIHGGEAYDHYEEYIADLKAWIVDPFSEKKRWRMSLKEELEGKYEVFVPEMPNKQNAKYREWKIWMDKYLPFLKDGVILVGHSLGGVFLAKYLSEEDMTVKVGAFYLVSAPLFLLTDKRGGDFRLDPQKLTDVDRKVNKIAIFHAKDDPVVPVSNALAYKEALPGARLVVFEQGGHFIQETFPELIEDIKRLG